MSYGFLYDLHCHSTVSDGILSPEELVSRAKAQGVSHLALTDHDTVAGVSQAQKAAEHEGMTIIPGVEFSTQWAGIGVHIVGLNVDVADNLLIKALSYQEQARKGRAVEIGQRLAKVGIANAWEGAVALAGSEAVGRPHFAKFLVDGGHVKNFNSAFKKYLGAGKLGDVKQVWLDMEAVVQAITNAGGVAVLAHPLKYKMTLNKLRKLTDAFKACGGQALEVVSGAQTDNQTESMAGLAARFEMHASCGSDFHVPGNGWQELGRFSTLPASCNPVWELWC